MGSFELGQPDKMGQGSILPTGLPPDIRIQPEGTVPRPSYPVPLGPEVIRPADDWRSTEPRASVIYSASGGAEVTDDGSTPDPSIVVPPTPPNLPSTVPAPDRNLIESATDVTRVVERAADVEPHLGPGEVARLDEDGEWSHEEAYVPAEDVVADTVSGSAAGYVDAARHEQELVGIERNIVYVPADNAGVARGYTDPDTDSPILRAGSEGCRIVSFYDSETKTGALVHINAADMGDTHGEETINHLLAQYPELDRPSVVAKVMGDEIAEQFDQPGADESDGEDSDTEEPLGRTWNDRLADELEAAGFADVEIIHEGTGKDVFLDTGTGGILVLDNQGTILYPPYAEGDAQTVDPDGPEPSPDGDRADAPATANEGNRPELAHPQDAVSDEQTGSPDRIMSKMSGMLSELMDAQLVSRSQVARDLGMSISSLNQLLNGDYLPRSPSTVREVAERLGATPEQMTEIMDDYRQGRQFIKEYGLPSFLAIKNQAVPNPFGDQAPLRELINDAVRNGHNPVTLFAGDNDHYYDPTTGQALVLDRHGVEVYRFTPATPPAVQPDQSVNQESRLPTVWSPPPPPNALKQAQQELDASGAEHVSERELALRAGISPAAVSRALNGKGTLTTAEARHLLTAMGVQPADVPHKINQYLNQVRSELIPGSRHLRPTAQAAGELAIGERRHRDARGQQRELLRAINTAVQEQGGRLSNYLTKSQQRALSSLLDPNKTTIEIIREGVDSPSRVASRIIERVLNKRPELRQVISNIQSGEQGVTEDATLQRHLSAISMPQHVLANQLNMPLKHLNAIINGRVDPTSAQIDQIALKLHLSPRAVRRLLQNTRDKRQSRNGQ